MNVPYEKLTPAQKAERKVNRKRYYNQYMLLRERSDKALSEGRRQEAQELFLEAERCFQLYRQNGGSRKNGGLKG